MSEGQPLKFWNGRSPKREWEHCYIAAYTVKDAIQLYNDAFHSGGAGEIKDYFSPRWGTHAERELLPTAKRGIYLTDRECKARMFIAPKTRSIIEDAPEEAKKAAAEQPMPENYGRLRVGFERGVKVDEWTFSSPYADRALADRMKAVVRLERTNKYRDPNHQESGDYSRVVEFVATSECFGKGNALRHSNIEKLFEMVQEEFRTYDLAQRGVVWEDWLEIVVQPSSNYDSKVSAGFTLGYRKLKRGVDPRNGRVMTISHHNIVTDFPKPKAAGEKDRHPKTGKLPREDGSLRDYFSAREEAYQFAYLPATPENIAALDSIMVAVRTARVRLEGLLNQRDISKSLASIPSVPLLEHQP
jgi:hypothetical protein